MSVSLKTVLICDSCQHNFTVTEVTGSTLTVFIPVGTTVMKRVFTSEQQSEGTEAVMCLPAQWALHGYCPGCGEKLDNITEDSAEEITAAVHVLLTDIEHRQIERKLQFVDGALEEARTLIESEIRK